MVKEIQGAAEFDREIRGPGLVVVDFFTTWCGPCRQIAPFIEALATKYPEVKFLKVDIEKNEDISAPLRISSIPTFHFYVNGVLKEEMKGANPPVLEQKIQQYKPASAFGGAGFKLQASTETAGLSAREARLRQFGTLETSAPAAAPAPTPAPSQPMEVVRNEEEEALAQAMALSLAENASRAEADAQDRADLAAAELELARLDHAAPEIHVHPTDGQEWEEEMVPVPVNEELLRELLEMGFSDIRARKGLVHGKNVDGAIAWIDEHQDDADIDQPYMVKKSDTIPKPPLSAEEKAQRLEEMKKKIAQRREQRAKEEKAAEIQREKERRERGQKMDETMEERQRMQRKREAERLKKEKEDAAAERARLRAEIARDKEIRRTHHGVIPSVLGVEGYNPSAVQYDLQPSSAATGTQPAVQSAAQAQPELSAAERVDHAISTISRYRTGGDGGAALRLLVTFLKNIVEQPQEAKYRSINTESAAYKGKLLPLVGPAALLKAVGFEKDEATGKLKYDGDGASPLLRSTLQKLVEAEALYRQLNP
eukprot:gene8045-8875_t